MLFSLLKIIIDFSLITVWSAHFFIWFGFNTTARICRVCHCQNNSNHEQKILHFFTNLTKVSDQQLWVNWFNFNQNDAFQNRFFLFIFFLQKIPLNLLVFQSKAILEAFAYVWIKANNHTETYGNMTSFAFLAGFRYIWNRWTGWNFRFLLQMCFSQFFEFGEQI